MRNNNYRKKELKKWFYRKLIGGVIIFIIIMITIIITTMNESTQIYHEGTVKSVPLLSNEKMKKLGNEFIKMQREFENEIMNMQINFANRTNKRGDKIYYGVNGKENAEEVLNDDYVNGIESIKYIKGKSKERKDGESNFIDMVSFLSASLGSEIDKYSDEELIEIFKNLYYLTHTFVGSSTELYPCEHGCSWCKYYCGDYLVRDDSGEKGFYESDEYMGKEGEYGLMYDPFLISKKSNYSELQEKAVDGDNMFTVFHNKGEYKTQVNNNSVSYKEEKTYGRVKNEDIEIFDLVEAEGYCEVCSYYVRPYRKTTKTFAGCNEELNCYHGTPYTESDEDGNTRLISLQCMHQEKINNCESYEAVYECYYEEPENESEDAEPHTCENEEIGCDGYYECSGHSHYSCPGHILVTCFGHTNLNIEIKIMYYEDMLEEISEIISN